MKEREAQRGSERLRKAQTGSERLKVSKNADTFEHFMKK